MSKDKYRSMFLDQMEAIVLNILQSYCVEYPSIAPSYLLSEFRHAHLFHGYNTRSRDFLRPPFAKTTKYQGSFRINGARTYNTLPRIIKQVDTLSEFKIKLKRHFKR